MTAGTKRRLPRVITAAQLLKEKDIEETCVGILVADGWRAFKMEQQFSEKKRKTIGERGMPDHLFHRYSPCDEILWIEFKRAGEKPRLDQHLWHKAERARGALIHVFDSIEAFQDWYRQSPLRRNVKL